MENRKKILTLLLHDDERNQKLGKSLVESLGINLWEILCHFEVSYLTFVQVRRFLTVFEIDLNCNKFLHYMFNEWYIEAHKFEDYEKFQIRDINRFIKSRQGKKGFEMKDNKYYQLD